jgi:hypothetical protein
VTNLAMIMIIHTFLKTVTRMIMDSILCIMSVFAVSIVIAKSEVEEYYDIHKE